MPYLSLDTSAGLAVAVVADDGSVAAQVADPQPRRHAEQLTPCIAGVLDQAGLGVRDLSGIVVGTGPAQFTGLRAGLVTARTLGHALGIPVLGVPSLSAVALQAFDLFSAVATDLEGTEDSDYPQQVVVVTDARRHEVYWARYARDPQLGVRLVDGPGVADPGDVPTRDAVLAGRAAPVLSRLGDYGPAGSAAGWCTMRLPDGDLSSDEQPDAVLAELDPDPVALWTVATALRTHGRPTPVEPLYLRRPDAVPAAGAKRVGR
ncbi:MAG: tRNA (adenosine(37)-N6)-threonylcarbamoyltransferase complex dimerization subunit type 1 TsaB [Micrococcales bacterium]|nr:tRNA (adenosine(37)-N6)-threonylcarbamoyltransferase complex dimerization subunit type 1 TsaB [Micrococcales bacterium]